MAPRGWTKASKQLRQFDPALPVSLQAIEIALKKGYIVTRHGHIRTPRGKYLKEGLEATGYLSVMLPDPGVGRSVKVPIHKIMAYVKFGRKSFNGNQTHVRHLDGDALNNHYSNIDIGSASDNWQDMPKEQRSQKSVNGGKARTKESRQESAKRMWENVSLEDRKAIMANVRRGRVTS